MILPSLFLSFSVKSGMIRCDEFILAIGEVGPKGPLVKQGGESCCRNAPTTLMEELGYGKGYRSAHNFPGHVVDQEHLPKELK